MAEDWDAIVIGGGFYGARIALYLKCDRGLSRVCLLERGGALLERASHVNQARVHRGYHYPRSFVTAFRSQANFRRFVAEYPQAVRSDFLKLYAIARRNSKVSALQFSRFCKAIAAPLRRAPEEWARHFNAQLIEDVFVTEEYAFDAVALARRMGEDLAAAGVMLRFHCDVSRIRAAEAGRLAVEVESVHDGRFAYQARCVFNCTYSGLDRHRAAAACKATALKHELTELALVEAPAPLADVGVTVMDGPFFSMMPFPSRGLHSLSHVRYTPHRELDAAESVEPAAALASAPRRSRVDRMLRDAARYLPLVAHARHVESLFETKTVLVKNEKDDGRPILFERHVELPRCYSILGAKMDNIYDVLERLHTEAL